MCENGTLCNQNYCNTGFINFSYKDVFTKERVSVTMKVHDFVYIFYLLSLLIWKKVIRKTHYIGCFVIYVLQHTNLGWF